MEQLKALRVNLEPIIYEKLTEIKMKNGIRSDSDALRFCISKAYEVEVKEFKQIMSKKPAEVQSQ